MQLLYFQNIFHNMLSKPNKINKFLLLTILVLLLGIPLVINLTRDAPVPSSLNLPPLQKDKADRFIQLASQNYFFHEYPKAIENYQNAIKVYKVRGETRLIAKTHQSIGDVYKIINNYNGAEKEYLISADYHAQIGNLTGQAKAYKKIGVMHAEIGKTENALEWYQKSLELIKNSPSSMTLGQIQETLGRYYWGKKEVPSALSHLAKARTAFTDIGFHMGVEHMTNLMKIIKDSYSTSKTSKKTAL